MTGGDNALVKKTHPIRGILWGLMFGLGLAIVLIVTTVINLELSQVIIVVLVGTLIGFLWGMFGPARHPQGVVAPSPPPLRRSREPERTADRDAGGEAETSSEDGSEGIG